jgi:hypothetical protein
MLAKIISLIESNLASICFFRNGFDFRRNMFMVMYGVLIDPNPLMIAMNEIDKSAILGKKVERKESITR